MLKNYLKIAFRNIWKNKAFSLINIVGLSIGLSASFVIGIMVYYDMTFDKFHPDGDAIYRITTEFYSPEGESYSPGVAVPLGKTLQEGAVSGVASVAPLLTAYPLHVKNEAKDELFKNPDFVIYADAGYFDIFKYEWLAGSPDAVLENPYEVVLSQKRAEKYFPDTGLDKIIGSTLVYNDSIPVKVTGVVANFTERTDLVFEEFISLKTAESQDLTSAVTDGHWNNTNSASQLFIKLADNSDNVNFQKQLDRLSQEHADEKSIALGQKRRFYMQPLADLHFDPNYYTFDFNSSQASKSSLITLSFVALFLLLLGCINFINLNTAQATKRAKEIGIRKTLGSSKKQLVFQFLGETFLLTVAAAMVSLFLAAWMLQIFSDYIPNGVDLTLFQSPLMMLGIGVLLFLVTFLSGLYPALVLSGFRPVAVLKNQMNLGKGNVSLRKYLTVTQFVFAQVFIIATLLVGKQLHYLMTKDMGFKTEAVAHFRSPWHDASMDKRLRFVKELEAIPQIKEVILGGNPPASFSSHGSDVTYIGAQDQEIFIAMELLYGDEKYTNFYGIPLLAGRLPLNDTIREYVINETCLKKMGFSNPQDAIGQFLKLDEEAIPIVGVMQDFNQRSLKTNIKPMAFVGDWYSGSRSQFNTIHFKLETAEVNDWSAVVAKVEAIWKDIYPGADIRLSFMDDLIKRFYEQEKKIALLLQWATGLAILISCLGLLGLVIHTTERRTKEIGIRKVLGASLTQLNFLLCKEFLVLVGIAFLLAVPIAWYGLHNWLQDFAYKTDLSWWVFLLGGVAMVFVALLVTSIRTIAAANANPVESLRTE